MTTEDEYTKTEQQLREGLSKAFSFVRSQEINNALSAVTMDNLLSEGVAQIDDSEAYLQDATSVDSTGRSLFVIDGGTGAVVRRRGKLQRLSAMAGEVLSEADWDSIFGSDYNEGVLSRPDGMSSESLFTALYNAPPTALESSAVGQSAREVTDSVVRVIIRYEDGEQEREVEIWVAADLLTDEQLANAASGIQIDAADLLA